MSSGAANFSMVMVPFDPSLAMSPELLPMAIAVLMLALSMVFIWRTNQ